MKALDLLTTKRQQFDLLITDYDMPGMNGIELVQCLLKQALPLPVIMISGREEALESAQKIDNIKKIMIKPYDKEELVNAIETILQGMRNK